MRLSVQHTSAFKVEEAGLIISEPGNVVLSRRRRKKREKLRWFSAQAMYIRTKHPGPMRHCSAASATRNGMEISMCVGGGGTRSWKTCRASA